MIKIGACVPGHVYRVQARSYDLACYVGDGRFIGIRYKFGNRYLFTEDHSEKGAPFGTVSPLEDLGVEVPGGVPLKELLGTVCGVCGGRVVWDGPPAPAKWRHDVGEKGAPHEIRPVAVSNGALFAFLDSFESA